MNTHAVAEALRQLAAALEADEPQASAATTPTGDLSVVDLAARFRRSPSTVRGWLEAGRFPGAYKLEHRDWRAPVAGVEAFEREQRGEGSVGADLGAWRKHRRAGGA